MGINCNEIKLPRDFLCQFSFKKKSDFHKKNKNQYKSVVEVQVTS